MQIQQVETALFVSRDPNGAIYDIHQIVNQSRPKAAGEAAPWVDGKVEWFLSNGKEVVTDDRVTFRVVGEDLVLTRVEG